MSLSAASPIPALLMSFIGAAGVVTHKNVNYNPKLEARLRAPLVVGIVSLLLTRTSAVTEPPAALNRVMASTPARVFLVLLLSFLASPDIENAVFLSILFLGLLQLMRSREERKRHPFVL